MVHELIVSHYKTGHKKRSCVSTKDVLLMTFALLKVGPRLEVLKEMFIIKSITFKCVVTDLYF